MYRFLQIFSLLLYKLLDKKYLAYYVLMIIFTYLIVISGLDFWYYQMAMHKVPLKFLFIADMTGFVIPILLPPLLFWAAKSANDKRLLITTKAVTYAVLLGFSVSTLIKTFAGRQSPIFHSPYSVDNSHNFNFGFLREQVVGGWPSSHTAIATALAVTLIVLYPKSLFIKITSLSIALFIGIGITFGFHWLSEFVAGILLGVVIGRVVGGYFKIMQT